MANLEIIHLSHLPPDMPVFAALYRDVTNAKFLREQLLAGNEAFEYAFVDAGMVLSRQHILAAVFRAVNDYIGERLRSKNVHSEIVFSLCSNNNISEAFRRFGVGDTTNDLLVLKVATEPDVTFDSVRSHLEQSIKGTCVPFTDEEIEKVTDLAKVKKAHKLGANAAGGGGGGGGTRKRKGVINGDSGANVDSIAATSTATETDERKEIEVQILGLMALRGAT